MKARRGGIALCAAAFVAACGGGMSRVDQPATPKTATVAEVAPRRAPREMEPTRYLRQLSLDLRGRPPSIEELDEVAKEGRVDDARIDAMLRSPEFLQQVRAWHRALLWPTVTNYQIGVTQVVLGNAKGERVSPTELAAHPDEASKLYVWFYEARARGRAAGHCDFDLEYPPPAEHGPQPTYVIKGHRYPYYDPRGVPLPYHDGAHCPNYCTSLEGPVDASSVEFYDKHPTAFSAMSADGADPHPDELDPPGKHCPAAFPHRVINPCDNRRFRAGEGAVSKRVEGWRPMVHYWSHGKALRTCAFEAQTRAASLENRQACWVIDDATCGCGPDGAYCMPRAVGGESPVVRDVRSAIDDEPLEIVASVVDRDEDYFDVLTTRRSFVTGELAFYFRQQSRSLARADIASPVPPESLPEVPFEDATWHEYDRGPEHAGVLTTTAYLLRFPTWRSRVSQFRTQFMCRPFTPLSAAMPGPDDPCTREPNLAKRCGCRNCHVAIEPMASWFGRWVERGARYLPPSEYPPHDATCEACVAGGPGCSERCAPYLTDAIDADSARYAGMLRGYVFRTPEEQRRIEEGPRGLVETAIASGELESCTLRTAWRQLVGRDMTDDELRGRLPAMARDFESAHRSYRALVRAIVTSPEYRSEP